MLEKNEAGDRTALDDAIVQCLRLFARHGRQIRTEKVAQTKTQDKSREKGRMKNSSNPG